MIICMYYTTPCIKVQRVAMAASPWTIKKRARLEPQVGSKSYIRFRGLAPAAPFARYFRYCAKAAKEMVSKKFLLDKVKGPGL